MQIESIRYQALRRFAETGSARGLPPSDSVDRHRNMLSYIDAMASEDELFVPPNFGAHQLMGNRKGDWALTVTPNWRLTLRVNEVGTIEDMDLEDYH
jgi:proteic killer suppression protein